MPIIQITSEQAKEIKRLITEEQQTATYSTKKVLGLDMNSTIWFLDGYWDAGDRIRID